MEFGRGEEKEREGKERGETDGEGGILGEDGNVV